MHLLRKVMLALLAALSSGAAFAQAFPVKPIRMIIGFPAGGPIDVVARILGPRFFEGSGHSVIVDNRAGANGIIATDLVAKSAPDGYTLLFGTTGVLSVNPSLYPNLPFDIHRDFVPLSHVSSVASLMYLHPSIPAKTLGEFIAYAGANPGRVNFSSSGSGGLPHLSGELLNLMAKIKTVHVPYKGTVPAYSALLGGEVQFFFSAVVTGLQHVKTGKIRALATTAPKRLPLLPDVPTASETLPGFEVDNWHGMLLPAGTPRTVVMRLHGEIIRTLNLPEVREKLVTLAVEPVGSTPEAFAPFLKSEIQKWARVIKNAKVRPD